MESLSKVVLHQNDIIQELVVTHVILGDSTMPIKTAVECGLVRQMLTSKNGNREIQILDPTAKVVVELRSKNIKFHK